MTACRRCPFRRRSRRPAPGTPIRALGGTEADASHLGLHPGPERSSHHRPHRASIVSTLAAPTGGVPLVDEIMVVDDGSDDRTAELARRAGARVIAAQARRGGKGQAMRSALKATEGDLIVFVDADVTNFGPHFVTGLLGTPVVGRVGHPGERSLPAAAQRRSGTGADGSPSWWPSRHRPALPPPGLDRAAPGRRDRRPPVGAREVRAGRRLCRRAGPSDRCGSPLRGGEHRPGRPRRPGSPQPSAVRAATTGNRHPAGFAGPRDLRRLDHS